MLSIIYNDLGIKYHQKYKSLKTLMIVVINKKLSSIKRKFNKCKTRNNFLKKS